MTFWIF